MTYEIDLFGLDYKCLLFFGQLWLILATGDYA